MLRGDVKHACRGGVPTELIFRSPAFNIDPVNSFKQQEMFARRVRPMVEGLGMTFLDTYPATRHAVLQLAAYEQGLSELLAKGQVKVASSATDKLLGSAAARWTMRTWSGSATSPSRTSR